MKPAQKPERTPAEALEHDRAMVRQAGRALVDTGKLILDALYLENYCLLDWPHIAGYIAEQVRWAMEEIE